MKHENALSRQLQHTVVLVPAGARELQANPLINQESNILTSSKSEAPVGNNGYNDHISLRTL